MSDFSKIEFEEMKRVVKNLSYQSLLQRQTIENLREEIKDILDEHDKQIKRRPVDMEQMMYTLYDNVEKQVKRKLDDYSDAFDRAINDYMFQARLIPESKLVDVMRDENDFTLSKTLKKSKEKK